MFHFLRLYPLTLLALVYSQDTSRRAAPRPVGFLANFACPEATAYVTLDLIFTLYTRQLPKNGLILDHSTHGYIDARQNTIFVVHGWLQNGQLPWIQTMKDAYLDKFFYNIIVVDWSKYADDNYISAFCSVPDVGRKLGTTIVELTNHILLDLKSIQINGFSLGAHVAGYAGQTIQHQMGGSKIGRINGLDAAGEGYHGLPPHKRLDASDADFVQAIHTSNHQFAYTPSYATVDFYVNRFFDMCGTFQSGCPFNVGLPSSSRFPRNAYKYYSLLYEIPGSFETKNFFFPFIFCNHLRAVVYFIESIDSNNFLGVSCQDCPTFGAGLCNNHYNITVMGENCPSDAHGVKYLITDSQPPFAKGIQGLA